MLSAFVSWARDLEVAASRQGRQVTVTVGAATSNSSARLDVDTPGAVGRVTFWESGDYHAEILDYDSGELLYSKHAVAVAGEPLSECFRPFLEKLGIT